MDNSAVLDRNYENDIRRRQGAFFTPPVWCSEAHRRIARVLGPDWTEKYVVVDPCSGTKNLTRDLVFK